MLQQFPNDFCLFFATRPGSLGAFWKKGPSWMSTVSHLEEREAPLELWMELVLSAACETQRVVGVHSHRNLHRGLWGGLGTVTSSEPNQVRIFAL